MVLFMSALNGDKVANTIVDKSFVSMGFFSWKDATSKFRKQEKWSAQY